MAEIQEIGIVRSIFREPADPFLMKEEESRVEVHETFSEGLYGIEENRYLQIIFHLHKSDSYLLRTEWYYGGERGVFACRTPHRPGAVGVTEVELLKRSGRTLIVKGLDALDGTPVLDIKPGVHRPHQLQAHQQNHVSHQNTQQQKTNEESSPFSPASEQPREENSSESADFTKRYPRSSMIRLMKTGNLHDILLQAGTLHGHYCPGLASGVLAAYYGMKVLAEQTGVSLARMQNSEGMEELLAAVEINSCFADGVQYVSGCTLGNNGLMYRDFGKTAVTFCLRGSTESRLENQQGAQASVSVQSSEAQSSESRTSVEGLSVTGIRIRPREGIFDCIDEIASEYRDLFNETVAGSSRDPEVLSSFKRASAAASFGLLESITEKDFITESVQFDLPVYAPIRRSLRCTACGEQIMAGKEASSDPGVLCRACAEVDYCELNGQGIHYRKSI